MSQGRKHYGQSHVKVDIYIVLGACIVQTLICQAIEANKNTTNITREDICEFKILQKAWVQGRWNVCGGGYFVTRGVNQQL